MDWNAGSGPHSAGQNLTRTILSSHWHFAVGPKFGPMLPFCWAQNDQTTVSTFGAVPGLPWSWPLGQCPTHKAAKLKLNSEIWITVTWRSSEAPLCAGIFHLLTISWICTVLSVFYKYSYMIMVQVFNMMLAKYNSDMWLTRSSESRSLGRHRSWGNVSRKRHSTDTRSQNRLSMPWYATIHAPLNTLIDCSAHTIRDGAFQVIWFGVVWYVFRVDRLSHSPSKNGIIDQWEGCDATALRLSIHSSKQCLFAIKARHFFYLYPASPFHSSDSLNNHVFWRTRPRTYQLRQGRIQRWPTRCCSQGKPGSCPPRCR